jgi:hypothetical protein
MCGGAHRTQWPVVHIRYDTMHAIWQHPSDVQCTRCPNHKQPTHAMPDAAFMLDGTYQALDCPDFRSKGSLLEVLSTAG